MLSPDEITPPPPPENLLYIGDNLDILHNHIPQNSVDLIYLDPPFNSNATYNVLFQEKTGQQSAAQITAFEDTWHWSIDSERAYKDVVTNGPERVSVLLTALRQVLGQNDMMAYLTMMAQRIMELHRVLKSTGSIYLHCDPTASHYLKLLMDAVFGGEAFRNEIIWHYKKWSTGKWTFQRNHDVLLFYARSSRHIATFNQLYMERAESTKKRFGDGRIISSVYGEGGKRVPSVTSGTTSGTRQDDVWAIGRVPPIKQLFPTQKPDGLLERIITASSKQGDVVLDPFCGCGTAVVMAERLKRRWIGIDITHLATTLIRHRLQDSFGNKLTPYKVIGQPVDIASARALATDGEHSGRYQFEWWALGLVDARPARDRRKGADSGVDGYINFFEDNKGKPKRIVVQVKSGKVNRSHIATLKGDVEREQADIGLFITLEPPTRPMEMEAVTAGFYTSPHWPDERYQRIQILTIEELLAGKRPDYPRRAREGTFREATRYNHQEGEQGELPKN